jgi:hypothetical protein
MDRLIISVETLRNMMEGFPTVKRHDEKQHGEYRTERSMLEIYHSMAESVKTGRSQKSGLTPPPGPLASALPRWPVGTPRPFTYPPHTHSPGQQV